MKHKLVIIKATYMQDYRFSTSNSTRIAEKLITPLKPGGNRIIKFKSPDSTKSVHTMQLVCGVLRPKY